VFAKRVQQARQRRGWTQQQLVDRLVEIGYTNDAGAARLDRSTIAKIEDERSSNTRSNAPLEDVLALAAALDCSPMHLLTPRDANEKVQVSRQLAAPAPFLGEWIAGIAPRSEPLRILLKVVERNGDDVLAFLSQMPPWYVEAALKRMGLSPEKIEDTQSAFDQLETLPLEDRVPSPSGDPRISSKKEGGSNG
jgi:transcriptional regulator with XRE-family HTH domain